MKRYLFVSALLACAAVGTRAQTHAPYPPFTPEQAKLGKQLIATTLEIRKTATLHRAGFASLPTTATHDGTRALPQGHARNIAQTIP